MLIQMSTGTETNTEILSDSEAARRKALLGELQATLAVLGCQSVLARTRRLVLRSADGITEPSGPTNPQLHVLQPGRTCIITTDGTAYHLPGSQTCPITDPAAAAATITRPHRPHAPTGNP